MEEQRLRLGASIFTLFILLICAGLLVVLRPFLPAAAWAVVISLTTWPIYRRVKSGLRGAKAFAPLLMTLLAAGLVVGILLPLGFGVAREVRKAHATAELYLTAENLDRTLKKIPWLSPAIAERVRSYFQEFNTSQVFTDNRDTLVQVATSAARGFARTVFNLCVCFVLMYLLYSRGEKLGHELLEILSKIGGRRFQRMMAEAREVTRAAVYGMVMTAIAQGALAGVGYYFAGAPVPLFLGVLTTILSLLPFGAPLVYIPVAIVVALQSQSMLAAILLALWGLGVVSMIDNILRPYFISQASTLPFLLVFAGVIGGLLGFGLVGIIIGPVIIAISRVLWHELLTLAPEALTESR